MAVEHIILSYFSSELWSKSDLWSDFVDGVAVFKQALKITNYKEVDFMSNLIRCEKGHVFSKRIYGNTCPGCNAIVREQGDKLAQNENQYFDNGLQYAGELEVIDPVVGWLVCIVGPQIGRDYKLISEKNFIGRAEDMHVQILGDNKIARRNHASIAYDPLTRKSTLIPGDSSELVYLNNTAIYQPQELSQHNVLQFGNSKFIYIPLCGEHWEWESMKDKDANRGDE